MIHIMRVMLFLMHANKQLALLSGISHYGDIVVITSSPSVRISCFVPVFLIEKQNRLQQPSIRSNFITQNIISKHSM